MRKTFFSLVFGRLFKRFGKVKFYLLEKDVKLYQPNGMGGFKICSYDEATAIRYGMKAKFYNKKDIPMSLDCNMIVFQKGRKKLYEMPIAYPKELKILSWESSIFELSSGLRTIGKSDLESIKSSDRVYFSARLPNNKEYKKLITKELLMTYLEK